MLTSKIKDVNKMLSGLGLPEFNKAANHVENITMLSFINDTHGNLMKVMLNVQYEPTNIFEFELNCEEWSLCPNGASYMEWTLLETAENGYQNYRRIITQKEKEIKIAAAKVKDDNVMVLPAKKQGAAK